MTQSTDADRHRVLRRQLRSLALDSDAPPTEAAWRKFLERVDASYRDGDADRYLLERSLEVSSSEMADLYEELRKRSESQLAVQHSRLSALTEHFPIGIVECGADGRVVFENPAWLEMCGRSLVESGEPFEAMFQEADRPALAAATVEAKDELASHSVTLRLAATTGACRWVRLRIRALMSDQADPDSRRFFVSAADVTEEVEARASSERLTVLLEAATDIVALFEPNGRLLHLNRVGRELLAAGGRTDQGARSLADLFDADSGERVLREAGPILADGGTWRGEATIHGPNVDMPVSLVLVAHAGRNGRTEYCSAIARDVTELKAAQDALVREATHDALTGLPNRPLLLDRLDHAVRRAQRAHSVLAVLYVDLDRFKRVNDSLGHHVGDQLIVRAAERLGSCVRSADTVARLGGDEFVVVAEDVESPDAAVALAQWIVSSFTEPFDLAGTEAFVSASVGIALLAGSGATAATLLRDADVAMYRAKERGRGRHEVYDAAMHASVTQRFELEAALRRAIDDHDLGVHYQPQIELATGAVVGFEALARWLRPAATDVPAAVFIPLAEETGLISRIGEEVLAQACFDAKRWNARGRAPLTISVNVSPRQLTQPGLLATVERVLAGCGLPAELLTLEITESVLVDDPAVAQSRLQALRDVGVRVSIDDFGKGYSSLSYLARFPLDQIKIDQVFVDSLDTSQSNRSIVASMIELAHTLELQVVAEGVERTSQLELLAELGCDVIQGYVVSPAVPPPAAAMWAERGSWRPPRGRWRASTPERLIGPERLSAPKVER